MDLRLPASRPGRFIRDAFIGLWIFVAILAGFSGVRPWAPQHAAASDAVVARVIDATSLPGPKTENAIVAAASRRPVTPKLNMSRLSAMTVLAMAFSLIFACNLAFFRHLRSAYVAPGRWEHRGGGRS